LSTTASELPLCGLLMLPVGDLVVLLYSVMVVMLVHMLLGRLGLLCSRRRSSLLHLMVFFGVVFLGLMRFGMMGLGRRAHCRLGSRGGSISGKAGSGGETKHSGQDECGDLFHGHSPVRRLC